MGDVFCVDDDFFIFVVNHESVTSGEKQWHVIYDLRLYLFVNVDYKFILIHIFLKNILLAHSTPCVRNLSTRYVYNSNFLRNGTLWAMLKGN